MTVEEFSDEFDTLIDAYSQEMPFGVSLDPPHFNEYEKSVFLTKAQEELVINYYSSSTLGDSFETSEEIRRYLDQLVRTAVITLKAGSPHSITDSFKHSIYALPERLWFIVYEQAKYGEGDHCINGFNAEIVPVTHDTYYRTVHNPFRGPTRRRVLRLDSGEHTVELVSKYSIASYTLRYIEKPAPIILADLNNLEIDGESNKQTCKLNTVLHRRILELGVQLALRSRATEKTDNNKK